MARFTKGGLDDSWFIETPSTFRSLCTFNDGRGCRFPVFFLNGAFAEDEGKGESQDLTSFHFSMVGREINERIEARSPFIVDGQKMSLVCECGDADCKAQIQLTPDQYDCIRQNRRTFVVLQGHESPDSDIVLDRHDEWLVVQKVPERHEYSRAANAGPRKLGRGAAGHLRQA